jgi:hypothetical protein
MHDAFDPKIVAAATRRADARLRHQIMSNVYPRSLREFPCPYGHGVYVQRGGPTPALAPSPPPYTLSLDPTPPSLGKARRTASRRARLRRSH